MTYDQVRAEAQKLCNADGFDRGIEKDFFGGWYVRLLPAPKNRYGCELMCEVIRPENNRSAYK